jgi:hypothetical protein
VSGICHDGQTVREIASNDFTCKNKVVLVVRKSGGGVAQLNVHHLRDCNHHSSEVRSSGLHMPHSQFSLRENPKFLQNFIPKNNRLRDNF